jgi:hypothetical protein
MRSRSYYPWYATGRLNRRDAERVEQALAGNGELVQRYELVRRELAENTRLNEALGYRQRAPWKSYSQQSTRRRRVRRALGLSRSVIANPSSLSDEQRDVPSPVRDCARAPTSRRISTRVNKPENDDPSTIEPIEPATDAAWVATSY